MSNITIVTSAGRRLGRGTAIRLARDFGAVVLPSLSEDTLADTTREVRSADAETPIVACDLREATAAARVVETTLYRFDGTNAIAFLFARDRRWITGSALRVDGGETKMLCVRTYRRRA